MIGKVQHSVLMLALVALIASGCDRKRAREPSASNAEAQAEALSASEVHSGDAEAPHVGSSDAGKRSSDAARAEQPAPVNQEAKQPTYRRVELDELRRHAEGAVAHSHENAGDGARDPVPEGLGHAAFQGPVGAFEKAYFYISDFEIDDRKLRFWVLAEKEGEWHAWGTVYQTWNVQAVDAVFFEDLHGDGTVEAFIIYTYMPGAGPEAAHEYRHAVAIEWSPKDRRFRARDDLFDDHDTVVSAAEARKILRDEGLLE